MKKDSFKNMKNSHDHRLRYINEESANTKKNIKLSVVITLGSSHRYQGKK